MTREDAAVIVSQHDGLFPSQYLDKSLENILSVYSISLDEFLQVCDDYTNYDIFLKDSSGDLIKRIDGSPQLAVDFSRTYSSE